MPNTLEKLESEAIQKALEKDWKTAISLNLEIVNYDSENIPALNRLAKAYIESSEFEEAKKILKKVLKLDPINQTAKRNLDLANEHKKVVGSLSSSQIKNFIKEPGTSKEFNFQIMTKGLTAKKFYLGEELGIEIEGHRASIHKATKELISIFDPQTAEKIIQCKKRGGTVTATFLSGDEKEVTVMVKSSVPLFKTEKQELKPYLKRDNLEEQEQDLTGPEQQDDTEQSQQNY